MKRTKSIVVDGVVVPMCNKGHILTEKNRRRIKGVLSWWCKPCHDVAISRYKKRNRKFLEVEPTVRVVPKSEVPLGMVMVSQGFWMNVLRHLKLLDEHHAIAIDMPNGHCPQRSAIYKAARLVGITVVSKYENSTIYLERTDWNGEASKPKTAHAGKAL